MQDTVVSHWTLDVGGGGGGRHPLLPVRFHRFVLLSDLCKLSTYRHYNQFPVVLSFCLLPGPLNTQNSVLRNLSDSSHP